MPCIQPSENPKGSTFNFSPKHNSHFSQFSLLKSSPSLTSIAASTQVPPFHAYPCYNLFTARSQRDCFKINDFTSCPTQNLSTVSLLTGKSRNPHGLRPITNHHAALASLLQPHSLPPTILHLQCIVTQAFLSSLGHIKQILFSGPLYLLPLPTKSFFLTFSGPHPSLYYSLCSNVNSSYRGLPFLFKTAPSTILHVLSLLYSSSQNLTTLDIIYLLTDTLSVPRNAKSMILSLCCSQTTDIDITALYPGLRIVLATKYH